MIQKIRDIYYGLQNLWRWLPVIWQDRDWDHAFFARIIAHKARLMADHFEKYGHLERSPKSARQLRQVAWLLGGDAEEQQWTLVQLYDNPEGGLPLIGPPEAVRATDSAAERYTEYAFELMKKHFLTWWD